MQSTRTLISMLILMIFFSLAKNDTCSAQNLDPSPQKKETTMAFMLKSPSFTEGEKIPKQFTCEGTDLSPALSWSGAPAGTQEFALISDDPDAPMGTWVHWVLYKIPATRKGLPEGVTKGDRVPEIGLQGRTDFGFTGYGGPCPPPGKDHRYFFKLYALSKSLEMQPGLTKAQLLAAMKGLVLGEAQLMGIYRR